MRTKEMLLALALTLSAEGFAHTSHECEGFDRWTGSAEALIWHPRKGDLDYAVLEDGGTDYAIKTIDLSYHPGARLSLFNRQDRWQFGATYTFFSQCERSMVEADGFDIHASRIDQGRQVVPDGDIECASGRYKVQLHQIDVLGQYTFEPSDHVSVDAFGGVRMSFIDQKYRGVYSGNADDFCDNEEECEGPNGGDFDHVRSCIDMGGGGLVLGGNANWQFSGSFSLVGTTSLSTQIAGFDRRYRHNASEEIVIDVKDCYWRVVNTLSTMVGVEYNRCTEKWGHWTGSFGYEMHHWFNMSDFLSFHGNRAGDEKTVERHIDSLGFDGFVFKVGATY